MGTTAGKQQLYLKHIHIQTKKLSLCLQIVPTENNYEGKKGSHHL